MTLKLLGRIGKRYLESLLLVSVELFKLGVFESGRNQVDRAQVDPILTLKADICEATRLVSLYQHFDLFHSCFESVNALDLVQPTFMVLHKHGSKFFNSGS